MEQRSQVFLIAEAGSTHDGDLSKALKLINVAAESGVQACKFQYWSSAQRLAMRRHAPELEPIYAKYQMPREWLDVLKAESDLAGIEWMVTCYLPEDLEVVAPYVHRFKVASFEAGDRDFLAAHLPHRKPLVISTGMMDEFEIASLSMWLISPGVWRPLHRDTALLHCTSAYPCPPEQAGIASIRRLKCWWELVGFSDHTGHELTGALAVVAGARVVEVHLRLPDTDLANPDFPHSLTPESLRRYIEHVRLAEAMLGSGVKTPQEAERPLMRYRTEGERP